MRRLLIASLLLMSCAPPPDDSAPGPGGAGGEPVACAGDEAPRTVSVFATLSASSEGIAFSGDGRLFVASGDEILELSADGTARPFATVPRTVGLAWWGDALYVASGDDGSGAPAAAFCAPGAHGAVWRVERDGTARVFAAPLAQPNFLAVTPWGTLLVSNDCREESTIRELLADGTIRPWLEGIPSANGMAFDAEGATLFVVSTFVDEPPLWEVPVGRDGTPGAPIARFSLGAGSTPDGLALDGGGAIYVALNVAGEIARTDPAGPPSTFLTELPFVASLAFGEGEGFDPCSMYVTSLLGGELRRVRVGVPGLPLRR